MEIVFDINFIKEVAKTIDVTYIKHKQFSDGTDSKVFLLNDKYLIKSNSLEQLKAEVEFFNINTNEIFQQIIYIEPNYQYVVYQFIDGEVMKKVKNPKEVIKKLIEIVSNYKIYEHEKFGYLDDLKDTWEDFLLDEVEYSKDNITSYIPNNSIVIEAINKLKNKKFNKKLLHGDFGTHNFIQTDEFVGVIDPQSVIGDELYDLFFAIVSNTDLLNSLTIDELINIVPNKEDKNINILLIVLYSRISRCLKYHPQDINIYMKYYNNLIKKIEK
ncbi:MAG: phosphotransferase [Mycoplasmatota bacterium]